MSADDAAQGSTPARRRRGRPPGAKSTTGTRTRRKRLGGPELTEQLNHMVAELIKENRKLKRQVVKLTERGTKVASSTVDRTLRTIQRRVQKALTAPAKRKRRKTAVAATTRKRAVTRRKGKTT
jgi:uncharacterized coiled-coil protein SlyX